MTPFDVDVRTPSGEQVLNINRGISWFISHVNVINEQQDRIGGFKQKMFSLTSKFDVMGPYAAADDFANAVVVPFVRLTLLIGFAICVGLALLLRRRPDYHKRLILLGTFPLMQSPFDRIGSNVLYIPEFSGLIAIGGHFALMLLFVIWDRRRLGYFHPVTKWGAALLVVFYLVSPVLVGTQTWRNIAESLSDM